MHVYGIVEIEPDGSPGRFIKIGKGPADRRVLSHQTGNPRRLRIAFWALYRSDKIAESVERDVLAATKRYATDATNEWRVLDVAVLAALDALRSRSDTVEIKWEIPLLDAERLALLAELRTLREDHSLSGQNSTKRRHERRRTGRDLGRERSRLQRRHDTLQRKCREVHQEKVAREAVELENEASGNLGGPVTEPIELKKMETEMVAIRAELEANRKASNGHKAESRRLLLLDSKRTSEMATRIARIEALLVK